MALDRHLESRLREVAARRRMLQVATRLGTCWAGAAFVGLLWVFVQRQTGWAFPLAIPALLLITAAASLLALRRQRAEPDWRQLAREVELKYPELDGLLLTAVQVDKNDVQGYLRHRLVREALYHAAINIWENAVPKSPLAMARAAQVLAVALLGLVIWGSRPAAARSPLFRRTVAEASISPGDTSLEKGSSLVVLARFSGPLPSAVELVLGPSETSRRIALVKSLGDPVFGASVGEVSTNFVYHVEYSGQRTRDFHVSVFEYPRLERADADLQYPDYTGEQPKHIPDTKRISAVEGSRLDLALKLNKPVASARLVPKGKIAGPVLELQTETNQASANLRNLALLQSQMYELRLVDDEGRTNKTPAQFVFDVLKNRSPELRLASPAGDLRPSALEEIVFEGSVWDDFGLRGYGIGYARAGDEPTYVTLGDAAPAKEKRSLRYLLRLEELGMAPDQLVCWFLWADDLGPDGQVRRTTGDLFFAEVRPFEEIYREGQGMQGESGSGQQQRSPAARLTELQKQIIIATWKLRGILTPRQTEPDSASKPHQGTSLPPGRAGFPSARSVPSARDCIADFPVGTPSNRIQTSDLLRALCGSENPRTTPYLFTSLATKFVAQVGPPRSGSSQARRTPPGDLDPSKLDDASVLLESQRQALEQAQAAWENEQDPRAAALWRAAIKQMELAIEKLKATSKNSATYSEALAAEQAAYQELLKLQEHQFQVSRARRQNSGQGGNDMQRQRQLDQMELTQTEDRYETRRQAQAPQSAQSREQSQLLNRLQELARRQQDLNERLKELQTALQEAKTDEQREEIRRQLKRLQEEEQRMLADLDELRQRMERPENQSRMTEQRQQLDRTRRDVQRAAEAAAQGDASQALASGARAQEQLQQMREQLRRESAGQFADDLRQMRRQARELSREQEQLLNDMQKGNQPERRSLSDSSGRDSLLSRLENQKNRLTNLVEQATQVSRDAENPEPVLSRELYDTLRKLSQDTGKDAREMQEQLLNRGLMTRRLYDQLREESKQDGERLLDITSEMLRLDLMPQARDAGQRTRNALDGLRRGLEKAAEDVLGDDTEALRQAEAELQNLTEQLQREMAAANRAQGGADRTQETGGTNQTAGSSGARGQAAGSNDLASARETPAGSTNGPSMTAGPGQENTGTNTVAGAEDSRRGRRARLDSAGSRSANGGWESGDLSGNLDRTIDWVLSENARVQPGPITGDEFVPWAERLRDIEEMLEIPELRNEVAAARERARQLRQDFKRDRKKPDWAVVRLQIINPLVEVRDLIAEELARRGSREALVPVDRDPVPSKYSDLVRTYYERLGK